MRHWKVKKKMFDGGVHVIMLQKVMLMFQLFSVLITAKKQNIRDRSRNWRSKRMHCHYGIFLSIALSHWKMDQQLLF